MKKDVKESAKEIREILKTTRSYEPDKKKFDEYVEWRRRNPTGTYTDFKDQRRRHSA